MLNIKKISTIYKKEIKELKRDKISRIMVFMMPIMIMFVFGYGMALDVEKIPFVVLDEDNSYLSRELTYSFIQNSRYYKFIGTVKSQSEGIELIDKGKSRMLLVIPSNFEKRLKANLPVDIQIFEDGIFPYRASVSISYSTIITNNFNLNLLSKHSQNSKITDIRTRYWFNEDMRQKNVTASGVLLIALFIGPAIVSSLLVVKEKEYGSIYNIYTSSIRKTEFILAKQLFVMSIFIINYFILYSMTIFLFDVPFKGSFLLFSFSSVLYLLVSTSLGILISTFVKTQVTAVVGSAIICIIPAILYSGYITPVSSMANEAYFIAHIFPNYYYFNLIKMCYLKGLSLYEYVSNMGILAIFYLILLSLSIFRFRKYE
ncbi:ABC transporter permease [Deferribacterales bacterium Es71-Z0220]|uniref:ABC transporter permease n=1 Tax=Deferrivibrio essentukiensis TaxID=2880922 RepID=UPI001F60EA27|nr:ABC transporter permease [Deferrivibrio essentukiensis]MCB4204337.1 ABC transporter permease [Deferrivibrio essentukiensis]